MVDIKSIYIMYHVCALWKIECIKNKIIMDHGVYISLTVFLILPMSWTEGKVAVGCILNTQIICEIELNVEMRNIQN